MKKTTTEMKRSYLVQRLRKPTRVANVFAFGGGLRNGGLSDDAMSLLQGIFSFDYMGAAEFEFGRVPEALQSIASVKPKHLTAGSFQIPLAAVAPSWQEKKGVTPDREATVYFLCRTDHASEVEARARSWAADGYAAHLKEPTHLNSTLRPCEEWDGETVGWLELDNGFFLFTDREMWKQTCALFGATSSDQKAQANQ